MRHNNRFGKSLIKETLERALPSYMRRLDSEGGTHTHVMGMEEKEEASRERAFDLRDRIVNWLTETYYQEGLSNKVVIDKHLKEAIMSVENITDKRPIASSKKVGHNPAATTDTRYSLSMGSDVKSFDRFSF